MAKLKSKQRAGAAHTKQCNNAIDAFTHESIDQLKDEDLYQIGINCYSLDGLYRHIVTQFAAGIPIIDPFTGVQLKASDIVGVLTQMQKKTPYLVPIDFQRTIPKSELLFIIWGTPPYDRYY